jgi:hypothetical protein
MRPFLFLFSAVGPILFSLLANADGSSQTGIHHQYQSPRPLGMGDAFVAIANDYNAVLYNPAGLARLEENEINLSMGAAASSSFQSFANDVTKTGNVSGTESQKIAAYQTLLQNSYGKQFSARLGLFEGVWVRPHFGMAVVPADFSMDLVVHNTVGPSIDVRSYLDTTIALGYGSDYKGIPGRLSWGVTGKFVNRGFASKQVLPLDLAADSTLIKTTDLQEGYTTDADIGFLYTPFLPSEGFFSLFRLAKPTFGLVVRNVGEIGFGQSLKLLNKQKTDAPEKLYRVLDVGAKFEYPNFWIFSGRGAIDIRDINHPNFSVKKGFHLGFEFDWRVASWWKGSYRIGVNQNYPTLGFSALFTFFNLDIVTYGEDVGTYDKAKENRMYLVKLNINI